MGLIDRFRGSALATLGELARRVYDAVPAASARGATKTIAGDPWIGRDADLFGASLTPQRLSSVIVDRNSGHLTAWVDLIDEMREKDPHLHSQLAIREQSVAETEFEILPGEGTNRRAAMRAADASRELLSYWSQRLGPTGESSALSHWLAEWTSAKYYGRFAHELLWSRDGGDLVLLGAESIDARRLSYWCDRHDPRPWALRLLDEHGADTPYVGHYGVPIEDLPREKILVCLARVRGAQRTREGMAAVLIWYLLFKSWSWRDVMALAEMIGRPPMVGYFAAGGAKADGSTKQNNGDRFATDEDIAALRKAALAVSGSLRAILPDTTKLDTLDYQHPTSEPIQLAISRVVDAHTSKVVHGVANLSDLQPGARAAVEVQERTSFTFWRSDVRDASRMLARMLALYVRANPQRFGEDCPLPIVAGKTEGAKNVEQLAKGITQAQAAGVKVPLAWAHRTLGIPEPVTVRGKTEPVLEPMAPKAAPPPPIEDETKKEPSSDPSANED